MNDSFKKYLRIELEKLISALTMTWIDTDDSAFWLIHRRIVVETLEYYELILFENENSSRPHFSPKNPSVPQLSSTEWRQFN